MLLKKWLLGLALCFGTLPAFAAAPIQLYTNNAVTTLGAGASSGATSITVASSAAFPVLSGGNWFVATLEHIVSGIVTVNEIVKVTAVSGTSWTVVRGYEGTTAVTWTTGDTVALLPTAGGLALFSQQASTSFTATDSAGCVSPTAFNFSINRDGHTVTVRGIKTITCIGTGTQLFFPSSTIPSAYLPSTDRCTATSMTSSAILSQVCIGVAGTITFAPVSGTYSGATVGFSGADTVFTYSIN